jgi:hypothetical protein
LRLFGSPRSLPRPKSRQFPFRSPWLSLRRAGVFTVPDMAETSDRFRFGSSCDRSRTGVPTVLDPGRSHDDFRFGVFAWPAPHQSLHGPRPWPKPKPVSVSGDLPRREAASLSPSVPDPAEASSVSVSGRAREAEASFVCSGNRSFLRLLREPKLSSLTETDRNPFRRSGTVP